MLLSEREEPHFTKENTLMCSFIRANDLTDRVLPSRVQLTIDNLPIDPIRFRPNNDNEEPNLITLLNDKLLPNCDAEAMDKKLVFCPNFLIEKLEPIFIN
jgi:hypothetical protein